MSLPPLVRCRTGCGAPGDVEIGYYCMDCHVDRQEVLKQKALRDELKCTDSYLGPPLEKRGPPSINHPEAFASFLERKREQDEQVIMRENLLLERQLQVRETSKIQLKKYMINTTEDEPVDPKEWNRYKYGELRDIPLQENLTNEMEQRAQTTLYCYWRRRTIKKKMEILKTAIEMEKAKNRKTKKKSIADVALVALFYKKKQDEPKRKIAQKAASSIMPKVSLTPIKSHSFSPNTTV
jgi:hypothetical protein